MQKTSPKNLKNEINGNSVYRGRSAKQKRIILNTKFLFLYICTAVAVNSQSEKILEDYFMINS